MTNMESTEASFVNMIMDRLQTLEHQNDILTQQSLSFQAKIAELTDTIEKRCPKIFLTPHSKYLNFNDGYSLSYEIFREPKMFMTRLRQVLLTPMTCFLWTTNTGMRSYCQMPHGFKLEEVGRLITGVYISAVLVNH